MLTSPLWRIGAVAGILTASAACCSGDAKTHRDVVIDHFDRSLGEIVGGTTVEQTLTPNHDRLSGIMVFVGTYGGRARNCNFKLDLRAQDSPVVIKRQSVACAAIADNSWVHIDFPPLEGSAGYPFVLSIRSPKGRPGDAVTLWMSSIPGVYPDGRLSVNGTPIEGALRLTTFHE